MTLREVLRDLPPEGPDPQELAQGAHRRVRQRRRVGFAATAIVLATLLVVAYVVVADLGRPVRPDPAATRTTTTAAAPAGDDGCAHAVLPDAIDAPWPTVLVGATWVRLCNPANLSGLDLPVAPPDALTTNVDRVAAAANRGSSVKASCRSDYRPSYVLVFGYADGHTVQIWGDGKNCSHSTDLETLTVFTTHLQTQREVTGVPRRTPPPVSCQGFESWLTPGLGQTTSATLCLQAETYQPNPVAIPGWATLIARAKAGGVPAAPIWTPLGTIVAVNDAGESTTLFLIDRALVWADPPGQGSTPFFSYALSEAEWATMQAAIAKAKERQPPPLCTGLEGSREWIEPGTAVRMARCVGTVEYELTPKLVDLVKLDLAKPLDAPMDPCQPWQPGWFVLIDAGGHRGVLRATCFTYVNGSRVWSPSAEITVALAQLPAR